MIQYKHAQAVVRRTIRQVKRIYWREFCSLIGSTTQIGEVLGDYQKDEWGCKGVELSCVK